MSKCELSLYNRSVNSPEVVLYKTGVPSVDHRSRRCLVNIYIERIVF